MTFKCWGKNKERVHVYKNITIYWLRNFRIRNIIKQQKGINAEAAGHYESESQLCMTLCKSMNVACQAPLGLRSRRGTTKFVILYIFCLSMRLKNIVIFMCT